jgi:hypothetical protein
MMQSGQDWCGDDGPRSLDVSSYRGVFVQIAGYLSEAGKRRFASDCVVGPRGFEPPTRPYIRTLAVRMPHIVFQLSPGISSNAGR